MWSLSVERVKINLNVLGPQLIIGIAEVSNWNCRGAAGKDTLLHIVNYTPSRYRCKGRARAAEESKARRAEVGSCREKAVYMPQLVTLQASRPPELPEPTGSFFSLLSQFPCSLSKISTSE